MINILLMISLIIIIFIIILLLIGIKITLNYEKRENILKGCLKILIFKKITIYTHIFNSTESENPDEEDEEDERDIKKLFELAKPCFEDLKIFAKDFLKSLRISALENHIIFGLDSYADTGKYIGIIWGILAIANNIHPKIKLSAEPSFTGSTFDAVGRNEIEIKPLKLIKPVIELISKKEIRNLIRGVLDG